MLWKKLSYIMSLTLLAVTVSANSSPLEVKLDTGKIDGITPTFFSDDGEPLKFFLTIEGKKYYLQFKDGGIKPLWQNAPVNGKDGEVLYLHQAFKVPVMLGKRPLDYRVVVQIFDGDGHWLGLRCDTYLQTCFQDTVIQFFDMNINGKYDDYGKDFVKIGKKKPTPLSPHLELKGQLYKWHFAADGMTCLITPYKGDKATLDVVFNQPQNKVKYLCLFDPKTNAYIKLANKQHAQIIPGNYLLKNVDLVLKPTSSSPALAFRGYVQKKKITFKFVPGKNSIKLGPPFKMEIKVSKSGKSKLVFENVVLYGVSGDPYRAQVESGAESTLKAYLLDAGKKQLISSLEYG